MFVKKNESLLRIPPSAFKEKLFNQDRTQTAKLTKAVIGQILTDRNNEIVLRPMEDDHALNQDQLEEQVLREKNAEV